MCVRSEVNQSYSCWIKQHYLHFKKKDSNENITPKSKPAGKKKKLIYSSEWRLIWAHVGTYGLVKWNSAHLRPFAASVPTSPLPVYVFFPDIQCCAHMSASAPRLERCTGKSNSPHHVVRAHLAAAPWVSLAYITCMERSQIASSLKRKKDPWHRIKVLFWWTQINLTLICVTLSIRWAHMQLVWMIKNMNLRGSLIVTLNVMGNCTTPGWHWNLGATLTGARRL